MNKLIDLVLLGISVGLGNFAAAVAIGISGVNRKTRLKVALVFGFFETAMPIVGLIIGSQLSSTFGNHANIIGGLLLITIGIYEFLSIKKKEERELKSATKSFTKLILSALALSIDNLIIGFSLGTYNEPLLLSAVVIGSISVGLAIIGLEIGNKLSSKVEQYAEILSGTILILVGLAVTFKII